MTSHCYSARALRIRLHGYENLRARIIGAYWHYLRLWECETCQRCGTAYGAHIGSWWRATDEDWRSVMPSDGGLLCPRCFTEAWEAAHPGRLLYWQATPERRAGERGA